jgi:hypothetical protein
MTLYKTAAAALTALIALAGAASAQGTPWTYQATVYLFGAESEVGLDSPLGSIDGTLSFSDALENLDFAFMGAFVASNGRWSILGDYNYTNLSFGNETPGDAFSSLDTAVKTQFLSGYVAYRVHETDAFFVDLGGGLRWFSTETTFDLAPGTQPGATQVVDKSWTDPLITMADDTKLLAVLIDADNTSPQWAEAIFEEIASLGEASVRRIYGDFSSNYLKGWADKLATLALVPHQQFANTTGKNSSDIALVIDAMDILHSGRFDGFVLISSDSDFTRLASRIREQGVDVYGIGQQKTPAAFRNACKRFIYVENLARTWSNLRPVRRMAAASFMISPLAGTPKTTRKPGLRTTVTWRNPQGGPGLARRGDTG